MLRLKPTIKPRIKQQHPRSLILIFNDGSEIVKHEEDNTLHIDCQIKNFPNDCKNEKQNALCHMEI